MTDFKVLREFQEDSLTLPVVFRDGQVHQVRIEAPSADDGLKVQAIMESGLRLSQSGEQPDAEVLSDAQELDVYRTILGNQFDRLKVELNWPRFKHVAMTAMLWNTTGRDTAEAYWNSGGDPNQVAPANREERRNSSRAAKSTQSRGSRNGTSTQKGTSQHHKVART